jgi:hypothetical protein
MFELSFLRIIKETGALVSIGVLALIVLNFTTDIFEGDTPQVATTTPIVILPSEYPDYEALSSMKSLVIASGTPSYALENEPVVGRIGKELALKGDFSRAYLYIEASVDNGKPLSGWDSIFMTLNYDGGHLLRSRTLKVPGDHITRLLYALNQVPVITLPYSDESDPSIRNWFDYFNNKNVLDFNSFLATSREGGRIEKIELRYECKSYSNCSIEFVGEK